MSASKEVENLLRELAPQVLSALLRRHRAFDECEDAVQEALITAAIDWSQKGLPENPRAWLVTVANRRFVDIVRSESARRRREERIMVGFPPSDAIRSTSDREIVDRDDSLILMMLCCHPSLTPPTQVALCLRAVGGLSTAEISRAYFVPESTMAQRISRAKQTIRESGATFTMPPDAEFEGRLVAVMHVLYLIFNEGYTASSRDEVARLDLTNEAIRLTRELGRQRPRHSEVAGLLALMLLTDARRKARVTSEGDLISLAKQDRILWDHDFIREGVDLVTNALATGPLGAYQLQAAIAAVHDEASDAESTDWAQILALYDTLNQVSPNPMATINRAVAVAMVHGPRVALDSLAAVENDQRVSGHHLFYAVRGHILEMAGELDAAAKAFEVAARRTTSIPEKWLLTERYVSIRSLLKE